MVYNQPLRLNQEWVVSNNRHIYLIFLDATICGYCKSLDDAENIITSLGKNIQKEMTKEHGNRFHVFTENIEEDGHVTKVQIYEQSLGTFVNGYKTLKHTLTYTTAYKCYYSEAPQVEEEQNVEGQVEEEQEQEQEGELEAMGEPDDHDEDRDEQDSEDHDENQASSSEEKDEPVIDNDEEDEDINEYDSDQDDHEPFESKFEKKAIKLIEKFFEFLN